MTEKEKLVEDALRGVKLPQLKELVLSAIADNRPFVEIGFWDQGETVTLQVELNIAQEHFFKRLQEKGYNTRLNEEQTPVKLAQINAWLEQINHVLNHQTALLNAIRFEVTREQENASN